MLVNASAIGLIIGPVAVVDVAINVDKSTLPMGSVLSPLSTVLGSIGPRLLAKTVTEATLPLACVNGARLESVGGTRLTRLIRIVHILCNCLACLLLRKVLATTQLFGSQH